MQNSVLQNYSGKTKYFVKPPVENLEVSGAFAR